LAVWAFAHKYVIFAELKLVVEHVTKCSERGFFFWLWASDLRWAVQSRDAWKSDARWHVQSM